MVIGGLDTVVEPELTRTVYDNVADLLNLEVDLLFFDTTSTYVELDEPDERVDRDAHGVLADNGNTDSNTDGRDTVKPAGFGPTARPRTPAPTCRRS